MKLLSLFSSVLLCLCAAAFADPPIPQSSSVVNLQFGPVVQQSDGNTPITGLLTGSTITATGGSTTTITTATVGYVGQYIVFGSATATTALQNVACYVTAVSGSGPYTLTVAPTLPASPTSSDTYNQSNIGVFVSKDGSTWATPHGALTETGLGYYYIAANTTDTNTIGPLKIHWNVYGSPSGIANESSPGFVIATNPYNATNEGLSALPTANPAASGGIVTVGTSTGQITPDGAGNVLVSSGTGAGQVSLASGKVLLQSTQTGVTIPTVTTVTNPMTVSGTVSLASTQAFNNTGQTTPLPSNVTQVAGQTANASAAVTFPGAIGTSTYAGADTSGTTTLLARIPTYPTNFNLLSIDGSGFTRLSTSDITASTISNLTQGSAGTQKFTTTALSLAPSGGGGGGDPWATYLPGAYLPGQAGNTLGLLLGNIYSRL